MSSKTFSTILFFWFCTFSTIFGQSNKIKRFSEIPFSIGLTQFLGDLGGANRIGTIHSLKDLDLQATTFNIKSGYTFPLFYKFSSSQLISFGLLKGNDAYTKDPFRNNRNLHFRSLYLNLESRIDFQLFEANKNPLSHFNSKPFLNKVYVYSGLGVMFFNPKAKYLDQWYSLQPIGTEGQGQIDGSNHYKRATVIIPFGFGLKVHLTKTWQIGFESTYYKTFSDYIDDASGTYCDPIVFNNSKDNYLANPSLDKSINYLGERRGKSGKDSFYNFNIMLFRRI